MNLQCVSIQDENDSIGEYEGLTVNKNYTGTLAKSKVKFSVSLNEYIHKSTFLIYNDEKKWREYPSHLFRPAS